MNPILKIMGGLPLISLESTQAFRMQVLEMLAAGFPVNGNPQADGFKMRDGPEYDRYGDKIPSMELREGIAIIPVKGIMAAGLPSIARAYGFTDPGLIEANIRSALGNPGVRGMILDTDSPGGMSNGIPELAETVREAAAVKPIFGFTKANAGSAAYWTFAPAPKIFATPSARVGSIGAYKVHVDDSKFWERMGLTTELFASGKYKGMGEVALTDDQRKLLQEQVDALGNEFKASVKLTRTLIKAEDMEGQSFSGTEAAKRGLITGVVKNIENVIAKFSENA